jgi:hypothetical protein
VLLGLAAGVRTALVDQLLLAAGEFDLAVQFVLGDGPLPLDGHRPALVRGPVGLLLDLLAGRGAQGPLHLGLRAQRHHAHGDHLDTGGRQAGLGAQAAAIRSRTAATPSTSAPTASYGRARPARAAGPSP